jgi:hypothetical protein
MPAGAFYGQEATMPAGASYGQEATMPDSDPARQRPRPLGAFCGQDRCVLGSRSASCTKT